MTAYYVVCPAYRKGPLRTLPAAQRALNAIEQLGACPEQHTIEIKEDR